jgi:2-iminobutanoate/2-iminopropanoate deaminase
MSSITRITTPYSYSRAVIAGDTIYLGLHRGFGDDFAAQLEDVFKSLARTLAEVGLSLTNLVKVNVWLRDIDNLNTMEEGFKDYFEKDQFPARMTSTTEFVDHDCLLMIEGIAYSGD